MGTTTSTPAVPLSLRAAGLARAMQGWADLLQFLQRTLGPVADLLIRVWLAEIFFVSGVLKASNWDNALLLAASEYPVSWLDPVSAAWLGAATELGGAVLLAIGLGTRVAAVPMLVLSIVIQVAYRPLDTHLFWAALFVWYAVRGAGALSLDRAIARGVAASPLPFGAALVRAGAALRSAGEPWLQLAMRAWAATALALSGSLAVFATDVPMWLPVASAQAFPHWAAVGGALALLLGAGVRVVAVVLAATLLGVHMLDARGTDTAWWLCLLALFALHGAGRWSTDALIEAGLRRLFPQLAGKPAFSLEGLPRVVIVGAGFGGLACAAGLRTAAVRVTLIDRNNYHLFQPLLYQVATAGLSPGDIATPVRSLFREQFNADVRLGEVTGVDPAKREVMMGEVRVPYDYLVLACGASHSYFGKDQWAPYAPGLKRVEDATHVRSRLLGAFEQAESAGDAVERRALLTFLVVGGGPTGVELAGAMAELARFGMDQEFRHFDPAQARVILVQAGPRLLPAFPEALSSEAKRSLERLGVEVLLDSRVEAIDAHGATVNGQRIAARTVLWAAGVIASPAARWLGAAADNAGRIQVAPDLTVPGHPEVFALGDTALSKAWNGQPVPGLAPAAKQGGAYVARVICARTAGARAPGPFQYRHLGSLATIGRKSAVADFGWLRLAGAPAWWLWGLVHVGFLVGLRNRVSVMLDWFWAYLTYRSGTRLITGAALPVPSTVVQQPGLVPPVQRAAA
jgi:NADH dehydrogenase/putative oxidoreductase